jgi:protein O-mannosyl-transferase
MNPRSRPAPARRSQTSGNSAKPGQLPAGRSTAVSPLRRFAPILLLWILAAACYLNADHEEFLFDSALGHIDNPGTRDLSQALGSLRRSPLAPGEQLSSLTFALNHALNTIVGLKGFDITTFLAVNVLIHAINASLVYLLIRSLLRQIEPRRPPATWIAFVPAAWFVVHPMAAGSIAYIIQRRGALATTFYLLAVLAHLRARRPRSAPPGDASTIRTSSSATRERWTRTAFAGLCLACYWLSFKSKELGLTLPFTILCIELCLRAGNRSMLKRSLAILITGLVLSAAGAFFYLWSKGLFDAHHLRILPYSTGKLWAPWVHFLTESRAFVHYWKLLILPLPRWSCIDHDLSLSHTLLEHGAVFAVAFHGVLLTLAVWAALRGRTLAAIGVFWFYVALIPYVLLPQTELLVEYKTYLPSVGVAMILAEGLRLIGHRPRMAVQVPAGIAVLATLMITTICRNVIYQNALNLWSDAAAKSPGKPRVWVGVGLALANRGDFDRAIANYQRALQIDPADVQAIYNLGDALYHKGDIPAAVDQYQRAVALKADFSLAHCALGNALLRLGQTEKARHHYAEAIRYEPDYADAHFNLANVLAQSDPEQAASHYRQAIAADPRHASAHSALANLLWARSDLPGAIREYRAALKINPDHAFAHRNLGELLCLNKDHISGVEHLEAAIRCRPGWWDPVDRLAFVYATASDPAVRNPTQAVKLAQQACRLAGQGEPRPMATLAVAYTAAGQRELARTTADRAIQLALATGQPQLADSVRRALQPYQAGLAPPQSNPSDRH